LELWSDMGATRLEASAPDLTFFSMSLMLDEGWEDHVAQSVLISTHLCYLDGRRKVA
jgi:hypothetical protein